MAGADYITSGHHVDGPAAAHDTFGTEEALQLQQMLQGME